MKILTKINENIHRLTVPYKDIYTSVFIIQAPEGGILFDVASYPEDIDHHILPALTELSIDPKAVKYIFISHNHGDHSGGLERLMQETTQACIVSRSEKLHAKYEGYNILSPKDGDTLLDLFRVVTIPGHSADSSALLDPRTKTLLTGDCLQLYGIYGSGKWGRNITLPVEHLAALDKLRTLDLETVAMAHDYHPCGNIARSKEEIKHCFDICTKSLLQIKEAILADPQSDDATLAERYNSTSGLPTVSERVFAAVRNAMNEEKM